MDHRQIDALMRGIAPIIRDAISAAQAPVIARLDALEAREPEKGAPGRDGVDGKDGAPGKDGVDGACPELEVVQEMVRSAVMAAMADVKDGTPGRDGVDGKDADMDAIEEKIAGLVSERVAAAVAALPRPADGKSVTPAEIRPLLEEMVRALPIPKDGKDGVGITDGLIDREGKLLFTLSDGRVLTLGVVVGKDGASGHDGAAGKDGADGAGFDDIDVTFDGERGFRLAFIAGDQRREFGSFTLPAVIYRGVWRTGKFEPGDAVTFGGSLFIARAKTTAKPETGSDDWQLAVKRGRDGKDGKAGVA